MKRIQGSWFILDTNIVGTAYVVILIRYIKKMIIMIMIDDSKYKSLRIPRQESEKLFVPKFLLETNQHFLI